MFGKTKPQETVLLLDIENGSVGSALAHLSAGEAPQLFGEMRAQIPMMDARSAVALARAIEHATSEALLRTSALSAHLRNRGTAGPVGKVVAFLGAPWGVPNLATGRPDFSPTLTDALYSRVPALFGNVPVSIHAHASAAVHGLRALYPHEHSALLLTVNGEVSELLRLIDSRVAGHATMPVGLHTVLRTLKAHAGMTPEEAHSALKLNLGGEALQAAAAHFAGEFKESARGLLNEEGCAVFVLAHEPGAQWFARALSHGSLAELFPQGGVVRALRAGHLAPFVGTQGPPDAHLCLSALYANATHK